MIGRTPKRRPFLFPGEEVKPSREPKLRLHGATKHAIETGRMRLVVTAGLVAVAFSLVGVRLVDLMVLGDGPSVMTRVREPGRSPMARADIVDRNGVIIATNLPTVNLFADAVAVPDAKIAAAKLTATLPDLKYDDVLKRLTSGQRFIYLRRNLTPDEQLAVNRLGIPGVSFENSESRAYLQSSLFAHITGNTDPDNHGIAGVEKTYDDALTTKNEPLALSLDVRVQHAVHESLAHAVNRFHAVGGSSVVMDVNTGEILAMVSLPDYDPKAVGDANTESRFNRSTLGLYEMGSTFKLFTTAMALESGAAKIDSEFDASQPIKIGRFTINDYHGLKRTMSVAEIMVHSSNIGAAKMALEAGTETQKEYLRKFGLLTPLKLELPETGSPQYPSTWREINTITISYGHGISVTPVHVAAGVASLVNGGILYPPTIIRRSTAPEGKRVISRPTSDAMRALMRMVVDAPGGTGRQADVPGYLVGGKTGSADKVSAHGGYLKASNRTIFVSSFPIDAPRYVVFVLLDEPKGIKETYNFATAGWNAVPTTGDIVAKIGPMLGVFPLGHDDNFQPLVSLMAAYTNGGKDEYAAAGQSAALVKTAARTDVVAKPIAAASRLESAPLESAKPLDIYAESSGLTAEPAGTNTTAPDSDSIGDLIGDLPVAKTGGVTGAPQ
ncbi:MAG: penicillin-binding protein 2 [Rhodospirillaceae bacterium]|nr:penicillin-binding protein 2 [Rhodospirillaceae bacterium]